MQRMPSGIASARRPLREWLIPAVAVALALAAPAGADVLVKQKTVSEGLGGFGNTSAEGTILVAGDKSRSEDAVAYTGRFKSIAGKQPSETISITRLDKELVWTLDPAKKQYTEMTFAQMREMMDKAAQQASKETAAKDADMKFQVDVRKTGAKETINGFPCEQVVVTLRGEPTDPVKAKEVSAIRMTMDQWMTAQAPGAQEMQAYYREFAKKLGREMSTARMSDMLQRMYGNGMKELAAKLKDLEGMPIRTVLTVAGDLSDENQAKMAEAQKAAADAQVEAEKARTQAEKERAEQEKRDDAESSKELGASVATGGGMGGLGGFLGKKLGKAASKKAEAKADAKAKEMAGSPTAGGPMFKMTTEVVSIATTAAPSGSFDIPAGYTQKKP